MPSNVDIKARITDLDEFRRLAAEVADGPPTLLRQSDTFFHVSHGRLKLRVVNDRAELIAYNRPEVEGPRPSDFHVTPVADAAALRQTLELALGTVGTVEKERWLYVVGQTQIHCDRVKDLGDFMELEVLLCEGDTVEKCIGIANSLLTQLNVPQEHICSGAYLDMLIAQKEKS
mmetsp:Transcript_105829/g.147556  ORF Transcript_105829/g.147556 Transcript_105829/m.147556 type:complete len:174 (-) Transcript_105829:52-573(-)